MCSSFHRNLIDFISKKDIFCLSLWFLVSLSGTSNAYCAHKMSELLSPDKGLVLLKIPLTKRNIIDIGAQFKVCIIGLINNFNLVSNFGHYLGVL